MYRLKICSWKFHPLKSHPGKLIPGKFHPQNLHTTEISPPGKLIPRNLLPGNHILRKFLPLEISSPAVFIPRKYHPLKRQMFEFTDTGIFLLYIFLHPATFTRRDLSGWILRTLKNRRWLRITTWSDLTVAVITGQCHQPYTAVSFYLWLKAKGLWTEMICNWNLFLAFYVWVLIFFITREVNFPDQEVTS